jgi:thiamine biosynthesis lipoprotein
MSDIADSSNARQRDDHSVELKVLECTACGNRFHLLALSIHTHIVAAIGHAPDGKLWRVGIQTPEATPGDAMQTIPLRDLCIATSGNYRQRFEKDGKSFSHLIDPRTGHPVTHALTSLSVIHPTCALADGYATALMILGPEHGREVADKLGLQVIWITGSSE